MLAVLLYCYKGGGSCFLLLGLQYIVGIDEIGGVGI